MSRQSSSQILIVANLVPLAGVLLLQWDVLSILLLYWAESVIIGVLNVARMIACQSDSILDGLLPLLSRKPVPADLSVSLPNLPLTPFKFFLAPFFVAHYGAFCFGHLVAVIGLFSGGGMSLGPAFSLTELWQPSFWIAVAAISGSHLFSFFSNYIGKDEYKRASLFLLMHRPYGRIVAMHIAIVLGAGLVMWLDSPLPMLLVLICAKIALDLRFHVIERGKLSLAATLRNSGHRELPA